VSTSRYWSSIFTSKAPVGGRRRKAGPPTRQAGRLVTDWHPPVEVGAVRQHVPGLIGGHVHTQLKQLPMRSSPRTIYGSPSQYRCLSKVTHDAGKRFCRVGIHRVLVQSTSSWLSSQK
jgi:hypothetical protein